MMTENPSPVWVDFVKRIQSLLKLLQSNEDEKTVQVLQKYYRAAYPVMLQSNRIDDFLATISRTCSALQDNSVPLNLKEVKGVVKKVLSELLKMIKPEQGLEITKGKVTIEDEKMEKKLLKTNSQSQIVVNVDRSSCTALISSKIETCSDKQLIDVNMENENSAADALKTLKRTNGDPNADLGDLQKNKKKAKTTENDDESEDDAEGVHSDQQSEQTGNRGETEEEKIKGLKIESFICKLEKNLARLEKDIAKIELMDNDLDDLQSSNSAYIQLSKWKAQAVKIHKKLCELRKESQSLQREQYKSLRFKSTHYEDLNERITQLINKSIEPPDFPDVFHVVKNFNDQKFKFSNLQLTAEGIFKDIIKMFKKRRTRDFKETFVNHAVDPNKELYVENMDDLREKLRKNKRLCETEIELLDNFANASQFSILASNVDRGALSSDLKEVFPNSLFAFKKSAEAYILGFKSREEQTEALNSAAKSPIKLFDKTLVLETKNAEYDPEIGNDDATQDDEDDAESEETEGNKSDSSIHVGDVNADEVFSEDEEEISCDEDEEEMEPCEKIVIEVDGVEVGPAALDNTVNIIEDEERSSTVGMAGVKRSEANGKLNTSRRRGC